MKKAILIIITALMVIAGVVTYGIYGEFTLNLQEIIMFGGVAIVVGFAVVLAIQRLRSAGRKEAAEDELSKRIMVKASSLSYYISIYWWLALSFLSEESSWESHTIIGSGILGMAIIFLLSWVYVKFVGVKDV